MASPAVEDYKNVLIKENYKLIESCLNKLGYDNPEIQFYAKGILPTTLETYLKYKTSKESSN